MWVLCRRIADRGAFIRSRLRNGFTPPLLKALTSFIKAFYVYIYHTCKYHIVNTYWYFTYYITILWYIFNLCTYDYPEHRWILLFSSWISSGDADQGLWLSATGLGNPSIGGAPVVVIPSTYDGCWFRVDRIGLPPTFEFSRLWGDFWGDAFLFISTVFMSVSKSAPDWAGNFFGRPRFGRWASGVSWSTCATFRSLQDLIS